MAYLKPLPEITEHSRPFWAALKRHESRGVHYRHDYPKTDDRRWRSHLVLVRDGVKSHQYRMESRTWPTLSAGR